jgi:hypothetical protein
LTQIFAWVAAVDAAVTARGLLLHRLQQRLA